MRTADTRYSGGEEVLLDVGGQDATEAFEDVGHSDEAREILDGLLVGELKRIVSPRFSFPPSTPSRPTLPYPTHSRHNSSNPQYHHPYTRTKLTPFPPTQPGDPAPKTAPPSSATTSSSADGAGMGVMFYAVLLVGVGAAFAGWKYLQAKSEGQ